MNGDCDNGGICCAIIDIVGEAVSPIEERCRGIDKRAINIEYERSGRDITTKHGRQRVSFNITVIAQDAGRGNLQRYRLRSSVHIRHGHRCVVDTTDRQGDGGDAGISLPVTGMVGKAVLTAVINVSGVTKGAVTVEGECTGGDIRIKHGRQRIPVNITVIA